MLGKKWNSGVILATQALLIYVWLIDLGFLLARYPGILTRDSFTTVSQVVFGSYDNTMPYYHTRLVGLFVKLGLAGISMLVSRCSTASRSACRCGF